jgi:hypothetical protein
MSSVIIKGDTSGQIALSAPAVAGTNTLTLPTITGTISTLDSGTAVSASGTAVDFTSIPAGVRRITVLMNGVSVSGTSSLLVQLGDSGGIENTGYTGAGMTTANGVTSGVIGSTAGFYIYVNAAAATMQVVMTITNISGNAWVSGHNGSRSDSAIVMSGAGAKTLSNTLDRIRITTVNGTDTFDAGSINILYE